MKIRLAAAVLMLGALVLAQDKLGAGSYKGTWTGAASAGDFHFILRADGQGKMAAEVGFTFNGEEIPCKLISLKVDGASLAMVYEFDLQGNKLQSAAQGMLKGTAIEGTYKTTAGDAPVDEGSWKAAAQ